MKILGYEIKKIPKEHIVEVIENSDGYICVKLTGNGWMNPSIETAHDELGRILNGLPKKLTLPEKVEVCQLIFPNEITFKIID